MDRSFPWLSIMSRPIAVDVLRGVREALSVHAPHLLPVIHQLVLGGLIDGPQGKRALYRKVTTTVPWELGELVLRALEEIEAAHGREALFAERRINFLVMSWRQFAEPRSLPPGQKE